MTVRDLAERYSVHYNTMRNWLADNNIQKEGNHRNSKFLITDEVMKKADRHFNYKRDVSIEVDSDFLKEQIRQKDILIDKLQDQAETFQDQISNFQRLLEQQQLINIKTEERLLLLEYKEEEETKGGNFATLEEKEDQSEGGKIATLEKETEKKLSFWKKIFR